jgi:hypothetical protein
MIDKWRPCLKGPEFEGQEWVTRRYQLTAQIDTDPVMEAMRILRTAEKCAVGEPNYLSGSPWSVAGSPWSVAGSPWSVAASPFARPFGEADEGDYWAQWSFDAQKGINLPPGRGVRDPEFLGEEVQIGIFDTCDLEPGRRDIEAITEGWTILCYHPAFPALNYPIPLDQPEVPEHGLFVAGLAHGVAPLSQIHLYKVLNRYALGDLFTLSSAVFDFVNRVMGQPGVINLSLGVLCPEHGVGDMPPGANLLELVLAYAHCLGFQIVAAAGNDSFGKIAPLGLSFPASLPFVHSAGASDIAGSRACFSNEGTAADGGRSTPGCGTISLVNPQEFKYWSGTSFATPLMSGLRALSETGATTAERLLTNTPLNPVLHLT